MPATLAELEVRVRALEDQAQRTERDTTDLVNTAVEIRGEVGGWCAARPPNF